MAQRVPSPGEEPSALPVPAPVSQLQAVRTLPVTLGPRVLSASRVWKAPQALSAAGALRAPPGSEVEEAEQMEAPALLVARGSVVGPESPASAEPG